MEIIMRVVGNYGSTLLDYINNKNSISDILNYKVTGSALSEEAKANLKAHGIVFGNDTDSEELKAAYSQTAKSAAALRSSLITLTSKGEDSLFAKDSIDNNKVYNALKDFVDNYNGMLDGMDSVGGTSNTSYKEELAALIKGSSDKLSKAGITVGADGKLVFDKTSLTDEEALAVKEAFYANTDFTEAVANKSIYVEAAAISAMYSLKTSNYSGDATYQEGYNTLLSNFTKSV
jgi:hypothetical protein